MKNTLLTVLLLFQGISTAMAQAPEPENTQQAGTLNVGTSTRAWLEEQGSEANRAPTEPFAAQRAAQAATKYLSGSETPASAAASSFKATSNATGSSR